MKKIPPRKVLLLNLGFIALCAAILIFLLRAPEETTPFLPHNDHHQELFAIEGKKAAEKECARCHAPEEIAPLPDSHPQGHRCLFCHKRQ